MVKLGKFEPPDGNYPEEKIEVRHLISDEESERELKNQRTELIEYIEELGVDNFIKQDGKRYTIDVRANNDLFGKLYEKFVGKYDYVDCFDAWTYYTGIAPVDMIEGDFALSSKLRMELINDLRKRVRVDTDKLLEHGELVQDTFDLRYI